MRNVEWVLQQISHAFQQCKNFENRLTVNKVIESLKVGTFLRHIVVLLTYLLSRRLPLSGSSLQTLNPVFGYSIWVQLFVLRSVDIASTQRLLIAGGDVS